jgi:hypothetical protein
MVADYYPMEYMGFFLILFKRRFLKKKALAFNYEQKERGSSYS